MQQLQKEKFVKKKWMTPRITIMSTSTSINSGVDADSYVERVVFFSGVCMEEVAAATFTGPDNVKRYLNADGGMNISANARTAITNAGVINGCS